MSATVLRAGLLTTVQDSGRTGYRGSGVSVGGALDTHSLKIANLLVGNERCAAGLEVNLGEFRLRFDDDRLVAWCGGAFRIEAGSVVLPAGHLAAIDPGEELRIAPSKNGARGWLAISGGVDVPLVLGSRSTDLRSGFGGFEGRALRDGDLLPFGPISSKAARIAQQLQHSRIADWSAPHEWATRAHANGILRVIQTGDFRHDALLEHAFTVAADSNRMGLRLEGPTLTRESDLLSEAVAPGTIQLPPNGHPILLLGDCQTIGGYPKIAHVLTVDLPAAAQLRPGDSVRFVEVSLGEAQELFLEREREVARFAIGLALKMS